MYPPWIGITGKGNGYGELCDRTCCDEFGACPGGTGNERVDLG